MRHPHHTRALAATGVAVALTVAGAAAVNAQGSGAAARGPIQEGKAVTAAQSARFGFGPGQRLIAVDVVSDHLGSAIRFNRTYHGLPVVGGDFVVHITPSGDFRYGDGLKVVGLPTNLNPAVASAAASRTAASVVHYSVAHSSHTLVVLARKGWSKLAWQISTESAGGRYGDVTYVSALTGASLASWPTVLNDKGKGKTLYSGNVKLNDVKKGKKYTLVDKKRGVQQIFDAHQGEITSGTLFEDTNNIWGNHKDTSRESAGADAAYSLAETWDYYLNTFGRDGIGDDGVAARGFVHVYSGWVNASWSDGCFCMRFGDGSAASGVGSLVSLDVGGHEMSHGVTSRTANLTYSGESGGLNESTSDVLGSMVEWYANNKHDVPDYVIGEEIFRTYNPAVNYIRRMDQPSMDGLSADCWYSGVGNLNVHYSSGVGNHLFYLLSEGSGSKTINGIAYKSTTCNGKTVKGIGHDKASAIWYKALTENWTSSTNYHDARVGMLQAAADLYGKAGKEYRAVNKAWAAVSVTG